MNGEQRVAIVTGAAVGIGFGVAKRLGELGHHVVLVDRADTVEGAARSLRDAGLATSSSLTDVGDEAAIRSLVAETAARFGRIDILVNNAGIAPKVNGERTPLLQTSTADWNRVLQVNLTSAFLLTRECAPHMIARKWGRIVNMSSRAGRTLVETASVHYAATKAGLIGFTRVAAGEFGKLGVTVNCIAPGRIDTPMTRESTPERRKVLEAQIVVGRIGTPDEIATAVAYLVSEDAWYVTGTVLDVNGGTHMN
jgi:3-oxoacyl-[acyl-carrier protein] reductase